MNVVVAVVDADDYNAVVGGAVAVAKAASYDAY